MDDFVLSWLVLAAISPLAGILLTWALFVCHTYRKKWRTLDLFVIGILVASLITCVLLFSYALLHLLAPETNIPHVCALFIWGLTSARTVQVTVLASMVVDRTLTVRWPYRYRFSVRRNQVRYHLSVLGVIALFVGVAAIFAQTPDANVTPRQCSVLPFNLDRNFAIFIICLQGACLLTHLVCAVDMHIYFCQSSSNKFASFKPEIRSSTPSLFCEARHFGSAQKGRNASRRPYGSEKSSCDIRWNTVMAITGICYLINHLPYLITTVMATFFLPSLSQWLDNGAAWLAVGEALLLPFVLCMSDCVHFSALVKIFHGSSPGKLEYQDHEDGKFRYADEMMETKVAPRNLFGGNPIPAVGEPGAPGFQPQGMKYQVPFERTKFEKNLLRDFLPYQGPFYGTITDVTDGNIFHIPSEPVYTDPLVKSECLGNSMNKVRDNDHIYATLSEKCGSLSSLSDNSSSVGSIAADDDFEFHNTSRHPGDVQLKLLSNGKAELEYSSQPHEPHHDSLQNTMSSQATTASVRSDVQSNVRGWENEGTSSDDAAALESSAVNSGTYRVHRSMPSKKKVIYSKNRRLPRKFRHKLSEQNSSLSMNDLDRICNKSYNDDDEEEIMYVLPVKSESMLSLYRIYFEENQEGKSLTKAISDGNLHYSAEQENKNRDSDEKPRRKDAYGRPNRCTSTGITLKKVATRAQEKERKRVCHNYQNTKPYFIDKEERDSCQQNPRRDFTNQRRMLKVSFLNKNGSKGRTVTIRNPQVSSVDDFLQILDRAKFSYLDNGDLCWHYVFDGDEPEVKKIFVTEYL